MNCTPPLFDRRIRSRAMLRRDTDHASTWRNRNRLLGVAVGWRRERPNLFAQIPARALAALFTATTIANLGSLLNIPEDRAVIEFPSSLKLRKAWTKDLNDLAPFCLLMGTQTPPRQGFPCMGAPPFPRSTPSADGRSPCAQRC